MNAVKARLIAIGNSRGVRIPKSLIEQASLEKNIEMYVQGRQLVLHSPVHPREGWEVAFQRMAQRGEDRLLDEPQPTEWETEEWEW